MVRSQWITRPSAFLIAIFLFATIPGTAQQAQPSQAPLRLTIQEAIQRGLAANLRIRATGTQIDEAAATRERRLGSLLPRARVENTAALQNRNLRAFGISVPGAPEIVPPFSTYDFRLYAEQPLFDRQAFHNWKASGWAESAARQNYQDVRDEIVRFVAGLYLNAQTAAARVDAAKSTLAQAEELYRLARERHDAGVATGVDVLRAQVELSNARQRLLEAQNTWKQSLVVLARHIGIEPGTPIELADGLEFQPVAQPEVGTLVDESLANRADYRAMVAQRESLVEQRRASRARFLPRLSVGGNYGGLGRAVGQVRGTGAVQATLSFTVFDWDREGEGKEFDSRIQRLDAQMEDLRRGIKEEILTSMLTLESATEEVRVAKEGLELAQKELDMARDRFQAGVANNLEVVNAQTSLERAQENYIVSVTRYTDAKMSLARAAGATEKTYGRYLAP